MSFFKVTGASRRQIVCLTLSDRRRSGAVQAIRPPPEQSCLTETVNNKQKAAVFFEDRER